MAKMLLKNVFKVYEGGVRAVSDFNLEIDDKEFVVFVGPSGCGKSTTLRMIAGLEEITAGSLYIDGVKVNDVEPKDRNIAMVFQNYALYPHMTVYKNMGFGLKLRKVPAAEIDRRVKAAAEILGITDLLERKPKALSGGQRQRVALGRAIVREPNVFLLDEPLSNLDAKLRVQMRSEIIKLHKRLATTFVYVTHDQTEAMTMGDRIVVMKDGYIQQTDSPATLYEQPSNVFVATFLGSPQMNVFPAKLVKEGADLAVEFGSGHKLTFGEKKAKQLSDPSEIGKEVFFGIRPENVSLADGGVEATVDVVEHLGSETIVYASVEGLEENVIVKIPINHSIVAGQSVKIAVDMNAAHVFDKDTKQSVMGVPKFNKFECRLTGGEAIFAGRRWKLPESMTERLFDFAEEKCAVMEIESGKVSLDPVSDGLEIEGTVDFTSRGNDSVSLFIKVEGKEGYFVVRTKAADLNSGDKVKLYVPCGAISFKDDSGSRVISREIVSENEADCTVKTENGKTVITVGGKKLIYDDLKVEDGAYKLTLKSDKLRLVYNGKYARKNKIVTEKLENTLPVSAYDEDGLGGKNAVFLRVKGFKNYVTAVFEEDFSVYKMPVFAVSVPEDAIILTPAEEN